MSNIITKASSITKGASPMFSNLIGPMLLAGIFCLQGLGCSKKTKIKTSEVNDTQSVVNISSGLVDISFDTFSYTVAIINPQTQKVATANASATVQILTSGKSCVALEEKHNSLAPNPATGEVTLEIGAAFRRTPGDLGLTLVGVFSSYDALSTNDKLFLPGQVFDASLFSSSCQSELVQMGTRILRISISDGEDNYTLGDITINPESKVFSGAAGAQGTQGTAGANGTPGTAGANGTNGADGAAGADGVDGVTPKFLKNTAANCQWVLASQTTSHCGNILNAADVAANDNSSICGDGRYMAGVRNRIIKCGPQNFPSGTFYGHSFLTDAYCCKP